MAKISDTLAGRRLQARGALQNRMTGLWGMSHKLGVIIWNCRAMRTRRAILSDAALDGMRLAEKELDERARRTRNAHYRLACLLSGVAYEPLCATKDD